MKTIERYSSRRRALGWVWFPIIALALLAVSVRADRAVKNTCTVTQIQLGSSTPGEVTYPDGQMHDKGHSATSMFLSENPFLNGRQTFVADLYLDADWHVAMHGAWVLEVGTWSGVAEYLEDPDHAPLPVFTPTGGIWTGTFEVRGDFFGLVTMKSTGHGIAGPVDGLQLKLEGIVPIFGARNYTARVLDSHTEK